MRQNRLLTSGTNLSSMRAMSTITRRSLLAGAAATSALSASSLTAQTQPPALPNALKGKAVLITGCSSGFGRLTALHLAQAGAKVFATMRNLPRAEADELRSNAQEQELDLTVLAIDVLSDTQVREGVAKAEELAGGALDILINNAGISYGGPIEIQDLAATRHTFDTNVFGPQRLIRAALPAMRAAKRGHIINISSQLGRVIAPSYGQYSPSKFALEALSEGLAYEVQPHGIDVTIVEPGGYPTEIWRNANANSLKLLERAEPVHTQGYPELVARLGQRTGGGSTDPMDVPRAIAHAASLPQGARPLRVEVHPGLKPQIRLNQLAAQIQLEWLGQTPYGPWIKGVHSA